MFIKHFYKYKIGSMKFSIPVYILLLVLLGLVLISGCTAPGENTTGLSEDRLKILADLTPEARDACKNAGGVLCEEYELCEGHPLNLSETNRCCLKYCRTIKQFNYSTRKVCLMDAHNEKLNYCYCVPNEVKNKVAMVVAKSGIFDSAAIESRASRYFEAVKKDLNIDNAGLKRFEGSTINDLEIFVDNLYINENVGYIILLGDDIPVSKTPKEVPVEHPGKPSPTNETGYDLTNLAAVYEKLECVSKDCDHFSCNDVAFSLILPPSIYSDEEKLDFILKILETYTSYHNNFGALSNQYKKSVLLIQDPTVLTDDAELEYSLPVMAVNNTDVDSMTTELKSKYFILRLKVHGNPTNIGVEPIKTVWDYSNFIKENGLPALFVDSGACMSSVLQIENAEYCCWPQAFTESGVWSYYIMSSGFKLRQSVPSGETIGMSIRKTFSDQHFIFGDILAHIK